jgi:hypothetical protein
MIEITNIEKKSGSKEVFVNGVYVGDKEMRNKRDLSDHIDEIASRGLPDEVSTEVAAIIHSDIEELKSYEHSACSYGCGHNTVPAVKAKSRVFDSGLKVIEMHKDKIQVDIPKDILDACDELQTHVGHNEFSIVCKGKWKDDGTYELSADYKVPKQKVEGAAVDYDLEHLGQLKLEGYNSVIHSHPFKSDSFSYSDKETINSHFECSVLYSLREFTTATIAISPVSGMKLIAKGEPVVEGQNIVPKSELDNIEKKFKTTNYHSDFARRDQFWYGNAQDFRGSGKQGHQVSMANENCGARSRGGMLTREIPTQFGKETYVYDDVNDVLWKNGKVVGDRGKRNTRNDQVHVHQVPASCVSNLNSRGVFTVPQKTKVFTREDPTESKSGGKKSAKQKKDNQPKIDII